MLSRSLEVRWEATTYQTAIILSVFSTSGVFELQFEETAAFNSGPYRASLCSGLYMHTQGGIPTKKFHFAELSSFFQPMCQNQQLPFIVVMSHASEIIITNFGNIRFENLTRSSERT
jgi:hypothetical protein